MTECVRQEQSPLRLAIQKKGRLADGSIELLKRCGLTINQGRDQLYARVVELSLDLLFIRDDDIPAFVADGACHIGIIGQNVFGEYNTFASAIEVVLPLGFSKCRLCIAVPKSGNYDGPAFLEGKRIATSYPTITQAWLKKQGVTARCVMMNGAVEIAPRLSIAEAICDIVSTGATLDANGLKPVETVYSSEAVLIKGAQPLTPLQQNTLTALVKRIDAVQRTQDAKYVMMNAPRDAVDAITRILPGAEAPTILELAGETDRVAIHAVTRESVFWETLEALKACGASAILVLPIEKMLY